MPHMKVILFSINILLRFGAPMGRLVEWFPGLKSGAPSHRNKIPQVLSLG